MSYDFSNPTPLTAAVQQLSAKTPIGSILRTAEWAHMPKALRDRGQFSAGVESVRVMQRIQKNLLDAITNARAEAVGRRVETGEKGVYKMDRQKFVADIRQLALNEGLAPKDEETEGGLQDITSEVRLDLIYRTQMQQARGHAFWKRGQKKTILNAWPAQELIRVSSRRVPRGTDGKTDSWEERWQQEGGDLVEGRMVALKTDEIWIRISRFQSPWPPFDFNSGMGLKEIDREEAIALGLLSPDEELVPIDTEFNDNLEASVTDLEPEFKDALKTLFKDQIDVSGDKVSWIGQDVEAANEMLPTSAGKTGQSARPAKRSKMPQDDLRGVKTRGRGSKREFNADSTRKTASRKEGAPAK